MSATSGRPRDPDVDRRLLEATRSLLSQGGPAAVTVAAVAALAEVGRPTVYRRYATSQALILAVLHADLGERWLALHGTLDAERPVLDLLVDIASVFLGYYDENPGTSSAMLQTAIFATPGDAAELAEQGFAFVNWIGALLGQAQRDGRLRPSVDVALLARAFFAIYLMIAATARSGLLGGLDGQRAELRAILAQHLIGLVPEDDATTGR